jgi:hypothetical protein
MYLNQYYVYAYYNEQGDLYYIGKGKGTRMTAPHRVAVPPYERIKLLHENLTDEEACRIEEHYIIKYGRKDLGTGILENRSGGGETSSPITRRKISKALKGIVPWNKGKNYKCKGFSILRSKAKSGSKHPQYGKTRTQEERLKISKGIQATWFRPVKTCPHCGKQGKQGMNRWHFNNCQSRILV